MGASLSSMQQELQNCRNQLSAEETNATQIKGDIAELESLRDHLRVTRDNIRAHRTTVREYVTSDFPNWRGNVRSRQFLAIARDGLTDRDYRTALRGIQTTLDNANTRRTVLRNKLLDSNSRRDRLLMRINTLNTQIQNFFNWN